MIRYILQDKKTEKYLYKTYPLTEFTNNINDARLYKTETGAKLASNNKYSLSINNGQEMYNIIKLKMEMKI